MFRVVEGEGGAPFLKVFPNQMNMASDLGPNDARYLPIVTKLGREMLELIKPTAVMFIGGVTESEIECIRALGKMMNRDILILTSAIVNGKMIIQQLKKVLNKPLGSMLSAGVVQFPPREDQ